MSKDKTLQKADVKWQKTTTTFHSVVSVINRFQAAATCGFNLPWKTTQTKEISFFLCGKCKHSFLYYFLLHSWQHCINREDREFKSVSDGLRPLKSLCSVRLHYKFCLHYLVFTFHKPVCLFQRHCRAERLSCQSRLCEAWRLRPVEVHRGRRILQG